MRPCSIECIVDELVVTLVICCAVDREYHHTRETAWPGEWYEFGMVISLTPHIVTDVMG